jgi:hypothetical protein
VQLIDFKPVARFSCQLDKYFDLKYNAHIENWHENCLYNAYEHEK